MGGSRSHSDLLLLKLSQNSPKPVLVFWSSIACVFCLYTFLKVVGYYDLSVLSMSVMGFQKKFGWGWVGGVSPIQFLLGFFELFNFTKPLNYSRFWRHASRIVAGGSTYTSYRKTSYKR